MSVSTTANLGLTLPYQTDPVAVSEQNSNMGLIDGFAGDEWANMGIVETGVTATHAIAAGQYVIWKGILYTADSAISVGTTLSRGGSGSSGTKNLTAVSNGGFNALNSNLTSITAMTNIASQLTGNKVTISAAFKTEIGKLVICYLYLTTTAAISADDDIVSGLPRPYGTQNYTSTFLASDAVVSNTNTYRMAIMDGAKVRALESIPYGIIIRATFMYFKA